MEEKIIIAVAPTGGWGVGDHNPITPEQIAGEVLGCAGAGASLVHMHARDLLGELSTDMGVFEQAVQKIRAASDIIIEASTGGLSDMTAEERALPLHVKGVDLGSLNMGSLNFGDAVYQNSLPDIKKWAKIMATTGVKPSLEIFDTGHLETALAMIEEGQIRTPANFSFIFNTHWGMAYQPQLLDYLISKLPDGSRWGTLFVQSQDFVCHLEAAQKGAVYLRVGFEDSRNFHGKKAETNVELVRELRQNMETEGFEIADIAEARVTLF